VDSGGTRGLQRIEEVSDNPTYSDSPRTPQKLTVIHIRYKQCGQYNYHCRTRGVYFVSEVLSDSKTWYFHIMKLAYTLLIMSCKQSHYFRVHQIQVCTSSTLGKILNNREATRKIAIWAIELSMYDIIYKPRAAIKAQALSNFVVEWTETQTPPKEREVEYWTINFDVSL
jgi:hypothetical protein